MTNSTAATLHHRVPDSVSFEVVTLTPELANDYLTLNTGNRPKKAQSITKYSRDLATPGHWLFTGEPIKFDWDGRLVDGQNRCYSVIETGVTIDVLVVRGLDPRAQAVMDSNAVRSARDALAMHGYPQAKDLSAAITTHSLWQKGTFTHCMSQTVGNARPTNAETVDYILANPSLVESTRLALPVRKPLPLAIGAIATAYDEMIKVDADDAHEFFSRIIEMRTYGKGDPVATLIKRVTEMHTDRARRWPSTSLFLLFRAWNAFRTGQPLQKFQFGSERRGWAEIPEPK